MNFIIPFEEINIFGSFFIENILSIKELLNVIFFVVFNGINYYEDSRFYKHIYQIGKVYGKGK